MDDFHLEQLVSESTFFTVTSSNTLDLVFSSHLRNILNLQVGPAIYGSVNYHVPVSFHYNFYPQPPISPNRTVYLYKKGDFNRLRSEIKAFRTKFLINPHKYSVNQNWQYLKTKLFQLIDICIPRKVLKPKSSSDTLKPAWFNSNLNKLVKRRDKLSKLTLKTQSTLLRQEYCKVRNKVSETSKKLYSDFVNNLIGNLKFSTKPFYRFIKSKRTDFSPLPPLQSNNGMGYASSDSDKADCLNKYFASVFTTENVTNIPAVTTTYPSMCDIEVSVTGVQKLLAGLDTNKSMGPDGLSPIILKECASEISPMLTFIFNQSLKSGILPDDWLKANIFALHKKGSKSLPENYRPISLTCICCKVLEHIVYSSISKHLSCNNILNPSQHGFRPGFSCETQLTLTINDWAEIIDRGSRCDIAVFDFSKAFDCVPHQRLLVKLKSYGISGTTLQWVRSFLSGRTQRVAINGTFSSFQPVTSGVPQGSVLGPLLFLLYINDIGNPINSSIRLFADDCILYKEIRSYADQQSLQTDINSFSSWADKWQMQLNHKKCNTMTLTRKKSLNITNYYYLNSQLLTTVSSCTYLGVVVTSDLRWHKHVEHCKLKAMNSLNFVRRNLYRCSLDVRKLAYTSLVRPHLEYASAAWDVYTQGDVNCHESIQKRAARFITGNYNWRTSSTGLVNSLNLAPLSCRRAVSRLSLFYKAIYESSPSISVSHLSVPSRSTRSSSNGLIFLPLSCRTDCYKYSFFPRTIIDWNRLQFEVRAKPSLDTFKIAAESALRCYY